MTQPVQTIDVLLAEHAELERRNLADEGDRLFERFVTATDLENNGVIAIFGTEQLFERCCAVDRMAVDADDDVVGLQAGCLGRGARANLVDLDFAGQQAAIGIQDSQPTRLECFAGLEPIENSQYVDKRDGKADARVVPIDAGGHFFAVG